METINEPRILYREFFLETAFQRAHNSWKHQTAQLSPMQFNSDWEETLNDIDELIQSELGCSLSGLSPYDAAHLSNKIESRESYTPFKTKTSSSDPSKWNLSGKFVTLKVIKICQTVRSASSAEEITACKFVGLPVIGR